jgi:hypothetical protein
MAQVKWMKGKCKGCGRKKEIWSWLRCYECAMKYEKEMDDTVSGFKSEEPEQHYDNEALIGGWD